MNINQPFPISKPLRDRQQFACRVSWYYYKTGLTQGEIAKRLGINRARVINILNEARRNGTVSIQVLGKDARLLELETALKETWGLREVMLVPEVEDNLLKENLSMAGAQFLEIQLSSEESLVGLGWGRTVSGITNHISQVAPPGTSFVTLCGGVTQYLGEKKSGNVGAPLSGFHYPFHVLPTPLLVKSRELRDSLLEEMEVRQVMQMAEMADIALVGIGALMPSTEFARFGYRSVRELDLLKKKGAVGEMHGEYFDADGQPLDLEHHNRLLAIRLESLKRMKHVVGVAGGEHKLDALRGALEGGFVHSLISDETTAGLLLDR